MVHLSKSDMTLDDVYKHVIVGVFDDNGLYVEGMAMRKDMMNEALAQAKADKL